MRSFGRLVTRVIAGLLAAAAALWSLLCMLVVLAFGFQAETVLMLACVVTLITWALLVFGVLREWNPGRARLAVWTAPVAFFAAIYAPSLLGY
jgi:hypothetical protein